MSGRRDTLTIPAELETEMTPAVRAFVVMLLKRSEALESEVAQLKAETITLKAELAAAKKTPRNSSLPPSCEHPHAKPTPMEKSSGRKRGGQPGHPKHERKLIPVELCDDVQILKPRCCRGCGARLTGSDPEPLRHQVIELPQPEPTNNLAERSLRHAVIWRKLSFGTQSAAGSRFVESILSVIATCRQQHRNPLDYLTAAAEAAQFHAPPPKLLARV